MTSRPISRRRALLLGGAGAAALLAGAAGWVATGSSVGPSSGDAVGDGVTGEDLARPPELVGRDGRLQVELVAAAGVRLAGRDTRALGYNGLSPGPTLRVRPGDELAVRPSNHLDQPTNLHTHGLRVSPQGNGDNAFVRVGPGASFDYLYPGFPPTTRSARTGTTLTTTAPSPTSSTAVWPVPCSSTGARLCPSPTTGCCSSPTSPLTPTAPSPQSAPQIVCVAAKEHWRWSTASTSRWCRPFPDRPSAGGWSTRAPPGCSRSAWKGHALQQTRPGRHVPPETGRPTAARPGTGQPDRRRRLAPPGTGRFAGRRSLRPRAQHDGWHAVVHRPGHPGHPCRRRARGGRAPATGHPSRRTRRSPGDREGVPRRSSWAWTA